MLISNDGEINTKIDKIVPPIESLIKSIAKIFVISSRPQSMKVVPVVVVEVVVDVVVVVLIVCSNIFTTDIRLLVTKAIVTSAIAR